MNEIEKLPEGFEGLVDRLGRLSVHLAEAVVEGWKHSYELGKQIVEYSETPAVRELVDGRNDRRQKAGLGGRPVAYHCYVAGLLEGQIPVTKDHMEECARAYQKDRQSEFRLGKRLALALAKGGLAGIPLNPPSLPALDGPPGANDSRPAVRRHPDQDLRGMVDELLAHTSRGVIEIVAFASAHQANLKQLRGNDALTRRIDQLNQTLGAIGWCIVSEKPAHQRLKFRAALKSARPAIAPVHGDPRP